MMPQVADFANGSFEIIGAICNWLNVATYLKDRVVRGVYWPTSFFYIGWGLWNLLYYPSLDQWFSFVGGCFLTAGNITWIALVVYDKALLSRRTQVQ
jgi:hypothetical protein